MGLPLRKNKQAQYQQINNRRRHRGPLPPVFAYFYQNLPTQPHGYFDLLSSRKSSFLSFKIFMLCVEIIDDLKLKQF